MWTHHISRDEGMINSEIVHCEEMIKSAKLHMQSIFRCKILFSKDIYIWMHDLWCDILTKHWLQRKNILRNISEATGWKLPEMRVMSLSANQNPDMWPIRTNQGNVTSVWCFSAGWEHCWWCSASRAMVRTGRETGTNTSTMRAQHCRTTGSFNTRASRQHHETHSNAVRNTALNYGNRRPYWDVFRSWQKDEIQIGVKRGREWEEIYLSRRRHNLILQVLQGS